MKHALPTALLLLVLTGCSFPRPWPDSPLYEVPDNGDWQPPATKEEALAAIEGRYAHYDIVAYDGLTPNGPLSTFIVTYGFTEFTIEDGELVETDCFCSSEYIANQNLVTMVPDAATQAIMPRSAVVDVTQVDGTWRVFRPATPTLIGVGGDPDQPLTTDRNDPLLDDADNDGKPGITVFLTLYGFLEGEIYLARREIFRNDMLLYADGSLRGAVIDNSEQLVLGASLAILDVPNNPDQWPDLGLSPLILIPLADDEIQTCDELLANRDALFPPVPGF